MEIRAESLAYAIRASTDGHKECQVVCIPETGWAIHARLNSQRILW